MKYRRDIDGLRAVAVVPVVIYHIAQSLMRGGYVGVDIFFVISGYLISHSIVADARARQFSARAFWGRRFRRIVPAHAVLLVAVSIVVLWRYFPFEAAAYGASLLATIGSVSNLYFWWTIDYFNPAGETFPLLHGWSLAVEEQFYLGFPLVVLALLRWAPARLERAIVLLFVASLALCVASTAFSATFGFYWIFARAWELLLGCILALGLVPELTRRWQRETAGIVGIAAIAAAMLFYNPYMLYPGYLALLPCLGAALVIHSGRAGDTLVARALSLSPLVFVGLISYSLYLWHWPLIAFQKADGLLIASHSKLVERGTVLAASFVMATLSWWLVERPTRKRAHVPLRVLLIGFGAMLAALAALAAVLVASDGLPGRFPREASRVAGYLNYDFNASMRVGRCLLSDRMPLAQFDRTACLPNRPERPTYLLIGDSHAGALSSGMIATYRGANILQVTASGCLPILRPQPLAAGKACDALMRYGLLDLPRTRHIDGIWLYGRVGTGDIADRVGAMVETAERLRAAGLPVTIIGPNPEYRVALPRLLAKANLLGRASYPVGFEAPEPVLADAQLQAATAQRGLRYVSLVGRLCTARGCVTQGAPGVPMLFDTDHFTREGGALVARAVALALLGAPVARGAVTGVPAGAAGRTGSTGTR